MRYVPALDGLRAVAILGVLVFHILPGALPGGFTGVDVFFVLSGYLIASVILHDLRGRTFSMREFYLRRIQRLLPNAVVMVGATVALATVILLPSSVAQVAEHGLWTLANLSNFFIVQNFGGYWQDVATATPLLHTWSLAVEEQFYLALPLTLWLLARPAFLRQPRAQNLAALSVLGGLALASYLAALSGTWTNPVPTFYLLPARAWEPLLGAALAVWRVPAAARLPLRDSAPGHGRQLEIVGWAGLAMIVAAYFVTREGEDFPGWIALLPTVGTLAVLFAIGERPDEAPETGGAGQLLARPAMVGIGKLSYSLYLWHWPLLVFARTWCEWNGYSPQLGTWIGAGLGIVLAVAAYWAIERPLRRRGPGRRRRLLVLAAGFLLCAAATLAVARRPSSNDLQAYFDPPANAAQLYNSGGSGSARWSIDAAKYSGVVMPSAAANSSPSWQSGGIVHAWGPGSPRVVVLGSSHALAYGSLIDDICRQLGLPVAFLSRQASRVFFDGDPVFAEFDAARRKWLAAWRPDLVIVIDRWDLGHAPAAPAGSDPSDASDPSKTSNASDPFDRQLRELVRELEPHTRRILLFSQVPVLALGDQVNLREYVTWKLTRAGASGALPTPSPLPTLPALPALVPDALEPLRRAQLATMQEVAKEHSALRLLRADAPFYLPDGSIRYASGRTFYYLDDNHLSTEGTELLREPLTQAIQEAIADQRPSP